MARRPGPPPKDPAATARRNADPNLSSDGWAEIERSDYTGEVPPIPAFIEATPRMEAVYDYLTSIPQAALYGPGTYFELWLALPLIDRYLEKSGVESFKGIISALGAALRLTEDDMAKARVKFKAVEEEAGESLPATDPIVTHINSRRERLTKASKETG